MKSLSKTAATKEMLADLSAIGNVNIPQWLIVHHVGGSSTKPLADTSHHTFDMVNADHKARGYPKSSMDFHIGYHYFIDKGGIIKQGRAHRDIAAHAVGYNDKSIGICLAGNFDATMPTAGQEFALKMLLKSLMQELKLGKETIQPHRKFANKTCYGKKLSDTWARDLIGPTPLEEFEELQRQQLELFKKML